MCSTMYNGHAVQDRMGTHVLMISMVGELAAHMLVTAQQFAHQHEATSNQYGHVSSAC